MNKLILNERFGIFAFGMSGFTAKQQDPIIFDECAEAAWQAGTDAFEEAVNRGSIWAGLIGYIKTDEYFTENCE